MRNVFSGYALIEILKTPKLFLYNLEMAWVLALVFYTKVVLHKSGDCCVRWL